MLSVQFDIINENEGILDALKSDNLTAFERLFAKFKAGLAYCVRRHFEHSRSAVRRYDPALEKDFREFDLLVANPMDAAWLKLTREEQDDFVRRHPLTKTL